MVTRRRIGISFDVPVADLFGAAAESPTALAVVEDERLLGVIPRVTLLSALGSVGGPETADNGISTTEEVAR